MLNTQKAKMRAAQKSLLFTAIAAGLAINAVILFAGDTDLQNKLGDLTGPILASVATGIAVIIVIRQGLDGIFGRSYAALAAGLSLYLVAEILWAYYSIVAGVEVPFPSLADAFWLAGYGPFGYGLFKLAKLYKGGKPGPRRSIVVVTLLVATFASYYIAQLIVVSDVTTSDGVIALSIGIAYPILDAILVIPAVIAVLTSGRGYLTAVPWIFMSWIFMALADSIFGFAAITTAEVSVWNVFYNSSYNAAYICMVAGLYWHNRYLIFDLKQARADFNKESAAA